MGQDDDGVFVGYDRASIDQDNHYFVYKIPFSGSSDKRVRRQRDKTMYLYIKLLCMHYVYECILYFIYIDFPLLPQNRRKRGGCVLL